MKFMNLCKHTFISGVESVGLMDGKKGSKPVGNKRFCCPEALFHPSFLGLQSDGIHEGQENLQKTALPVPEQSLERSR